jgi:hypothetical protein
VSRTIARERGADGAAALKAADGTLAHACPSFRKANQGDHRLRRRRQPLRKSPFVFPLFRYLPLAFCDPRGTTKGFHERREQEE